MAVTTALKALRGWRYVELMVSNWLIAAFADPTAFTVETTGTGTDFTLDIFFSASWISLTMAGVGT